MSIFVIALFSFLGFVVVYVVATLIARLVTLDTGYYTGPRDLRTVPTVAIVTGASSGVGTQTAREFAADGAHVFLCDRDAARSERAAAQIRAATGSTRVTCVPCDLADLRSVRECALRLLRAVAELRAAEATKAEAEAAGQEPAKPWRVLLCNNAGVMAVPLCASAQGYEMQYAVNFLGHFALTANLLPLLLDPAVADARVLTLSSLAHHWVHAFDFAAVRADTIDARTFDSRNVGYAQSKLADVCLTTELVRRLGARPGAHLAAYSIDPGNVMTNLARHMPLYFFVLGAPILYLCQKTCTQGAQTTITCALSDRADLTSGGFYSDRRLSQPSLLAQDKNLARRLWNLAFEQARPFLTQEATSILSEVSDV